MRRWRGRCRVGSQRRGECEMGCRRGRGVWSGCRGGRQCRHGRAALHSTRRMGESLLGSLTGEAQMRWVTVWVVSNRTRARGYVYRSWWGQNPLSRCMVIRRCLFTWRRGMGRDRGESRDRSRDDCRRRGHLLLHRWLALGTGRWWTVHRDETFKVSALGSMMECKHRVEVLEQNF